MGVESSVIILSLPHIRAFLFHIFSSNNSNSCDQRVTTFYDSL